MQIKKVGVLTEPLKKDLVSQKRYENSELKNLYLTPRAKIKMKKMTQLSQK